MIGKVKWYDAKKGFGFISGEDGKDYFIHGSNIVKGRTRVYLNQDDEIEFKIDSDENGKERGAEIVLTKKAPTIKK